MIGFPIARWSSPSPAGQPISGWAHTSTPRSEDRGGPTQQETRKMAKNHANRIPSDSREQQHPSTVRHRLMADAQMYPAHPSLLPDMVLWKAAVCEEFIRLDNRLRADGYKACTKACADGLGQRVNEAYAVVLRADVVVGMDRGNILELLNASRRIPSAATLSRWLRAHKQRKAASLPAEYGRPEDSSRGL